VIALLIFLSFWLGLVIKKAFITYIVVAIVFLLFVLKRFHIKTLIVCACFLLTGFSLSYIQFSHNKTQYEGIVYISKNNYFLLNSGGERLYVYQKDHNYDVGDVLSIVGKKEELSFNTIESSFDFNEYLNNRGVFSALQAYSIKEKFHNPIRIKRSQETFLFYFNEEERSVVGSILFSSGESSDLTNKLRDIHLARFLSASGIYISFFEMIMTYVLRIFLKDKIAKLVNIGILSFYAIFTFPRFAVIKIVLLLILKWINKYPLKRKFHYSTLIGISGLFFLLLNRYLAYQDSFVLGYAIPLISYFTRFFFNKHKIKSRVVRWGIIYLFFLPFEIAYYNKIVILSLPLQIMLTPLFLLIGFVSMFCFFRIPLYGFVKILIKLLSNIISSLTLFSFGINIPDLPSLLVIVYYAIYIIYLYYLSFNYKYIHRVLLTINLTLLSLYAFPFKNYISDEVCFINVGQGDCTLIRHYDKAVLIDTGGLTNMDVANDSLIPFLRKKRIYNIEAVFITHYDFDHFGALEGLKKEYKIKSVYDYYSSFPISTIGLTFNNYNVYQSPGMEENDKSLVISFSLCNKDFLVMGDTPTFIEKKIIKDNNYIPCDILRVGHHGSKTSTCDEFLTFIKPEVAIISVGKNNKFGHPDKEVVSLLKTHHITIRRTDLEGTITYQKMFV